MTCVVECGFIHFLDKDGPDFVALLVNNSCILGSSRKRSSVESKVLKPKIIDVEVAINLSSDIESVFF